MFLQYIIICLALFVAFLVILNLNNKKVQIQSRDSFGYLFFCSLLTSILIGLVIEGVSVLFDRWFGYGTLVASFLVVITWSVSAHSVAKYNEKPLEPLAIKKKTSEAELL